LLLLLLLFVLVLVLVLVVLQKPQKAIADETWLLDAPRIRRVGCRVDPRLQAKYDILMFQEGHGDHKQGRAPHWGW